jgi:hypothetical protein
MQGDVHLCKTATSVNTHECVPVAHFPGHARGRVGVECDVCPRQLTAVERRPPPALVRLQRVGAVPGRPGSATPGATRDWVPYLARPSPALRLYGQLEPSPGVGDLPREIDRPHRDSLGTGPCRLRRPQRRYLSGPLPAKACPAPCSLGREQFRDLTSCARLSPEPGGRDHAEVALADLAMTPPQTIRPHQGLYRRSDLFLNIGT